MIWLGFLLAGLLITCLILFGWIVIFAVRQGDVDFLDTFIFSVLGLFLGMLCLFAKLSSSYNALINFIRHTLYFSDGEDRIR